MDPGPVGTDRAGRARSKGHPNAVQCDASGPGHTAGCCQPPCAQSGEGEREECRRVDGECVCVDLCHGPEKNGSLLCRLAFGLPGPALPSDGWTVILLFIMHGKPITGPAGGVQNRPGRRLWCSMHMSVALLGRGETYGRLGPVGALQLFRTAIE